MTHDIDECVHLLPAGQCAYCSGSFAREREQLAQETRDMLRLIARKREREMRAPTRIVRSTNDERAYVRSYGPADTRRERAAVRTSGFRVD